MLGQGLALGIAYLACNDTLKHLGVLRTAV
jgi:hypothetical protein